MIVVAYLQVAVCTVTETFGITIQTEAKDRIYAVGGKLSAINQITTAFAEDNISFADVLKALDNTPVRIQGITCYFV